MIRLQASLSLAAIICLAATGPAFAVEGHAFATAAKQAKADLAKAHVEGELLVTFKRGFASSKRLASLAAMGGEVLHEFRSSPTALVRFKKDANLVGLSSQLLALPEVERVEPNSLFRALKTPNDPSFAETYGLHNEGQNSGLADADIDAPEAWEVSTGSKRVLVGVIDTGIDYTHPDLAPNMWTNPGETGLDVNGNHKANNGIDDDRNGYIDDVRGWDFVSNDNDPMDDNKHGTHCAGTIGAKGNDGVGVAGVNWDVSMVGLKFMDAFGRGSLANAVKAVEYATAIGVDLTSNSWGGGGFSETLKVAIEAAHAKGILFVAAAGNNAEDNDQVAAYPANYQVPNVITVAATDNTDALASFSSYGARNAHIAAPGVRVYSTLPGGKYGNLSGTSMATPHVAGALALLRSAYPGLNHLQLKSRLLTSVEAVQSVANKVSTGGRLNIGNALENDVIAPSAPGNVAVTGATGTRLFLRWEASGDDGLEGRAQRYEVRMSAEPVVDEAGWERAARTSSLSARAEDGSVQSVLRHLPMNGRGFVTVRAFDNVSNASSLSRSVAFELKRMAIALSNDGESMDGITASWPWGLEAVQGRGNVFSDSPGTYYARDTNASLDFGTLPSPGGEAILSFDHSIESEPKYDNGIVEVNAGGAWKEVARFSGSAAWKQETIDLGSTLAGAESFGLRFRFTSDSSISGDGWKLDALRVLNTAPSSRQEP